MPELAQLGELSDLLALGCAVVVVAAAVAEATNLYMTHTGPGPVATMMVVAPMAEPLEQTGTGWNTHVCLGKIWLLVPHTHEQHLEHTDGISDLKRRETAQRGGLCLPTLPLTWSTASTACQHVFFAEG